jgi:hypothetical protein
LDELRFGTTWDEVRLAAIPEASSLGPARGVVSLATLWTARRRASESANRKRRE